MRFLRPLPVHVALAMSGRPENVNAGQEIEDPNPVFIEGILKYQSHPYQRDIPALDLVWEKGCSKLFYCPATEKNEKWPSRSVVFLVPSLINRATILDLMADKSFVRWLAGQGHDVYLLDWGDVTEDGKLQNMDDIVEKRLCAAGRNLLSLIGDAGETANLTGLGYCMGGTLLAAAAAIAPEIWGRLVFLASPWDFHAGDAVLQTHICSSAPLALDMIETKGILPMEWIQTVFAAVNGDRGREKFVKFA